MGELRAALTGLPSGLEEGNEGVRISRKLEDPDKVSSSRTHEFVLWKFNSAGDEVHVRYMRTEGDSSAWVEVETPPEVLAYPDPLWNGVVVPQVAARGGFTEPLNVDAQVYLRSLIQPLRGGASTQILSTALEPEKRNKTDKPDPDRGIVLFDTRMMRIVGRLYLRYPPVGDSAEFRIVAPEDVPVERYRVYASNKKKLAAAAETAASAAAAQEAAPPVKETTPSVVAETAALPADPAAGLDYPSDNAGLRRAVLQNGQLIVWGYSASQPDQTVKIEAVEVKGSKARLAFTTPADVLIYRDKLWKTVVEKIRAKGGLASPAAREYLQSLVNRGKPESRLVLGMKTEKDYGATDLYPPDQRGEPIILLDTSTFRIIAFVYLRAVDSSKKLSMKAELRVVAPNDVRLDHPEAYEGKKARSNAEQPPADEAGLEEAIPYDQALLVPDDSLNPVRLFTSRQDQPANLFLSVGPGGVSISKKYLAEWGNRGFLVMNSLAGGMQFLQISVTRRSPFPKVSTVFYASDAASKRQRLNGAGASRTIDGIRVEVTSEGLIVRPDKGAQIYVERLMTPQEKKVQDLQNEMSRFLEGQRWDHVADLLSRAGRLSLPDRANQSPLMRRTLDLLEIGRFQMLVNRRLPAIWLVGDPISRSAENDSWKMLELADRFLRQNPPVDPQYRKLVRTLIAQTVLTLSAAGSLTEKVQVERIFTNPEVPLGHIVSLLHERWLARLLQEQQARGGQLELPSPFYTRALAYGLVNNVVPASQYLSPSDQARSPDSLLIFLQGGLNVPLPELERRRQAVRRVISKEIWDIAGGSPGRLPQDLLEETLMPYDLSILEVGSVAAHLLGRVAEELGLAGDAAKFRQMRIQLDQEREEVPHKLAPRLDVTTLVDQGIDEVAANNLTTHDQVLHALRGGIIRLLGERTEEPGVEPDWVHFYSEDPFLDYWVEVGALETWTENWDQAVPQMRAALQFLDQGMGHQLYQVHFRTIRQREQGRWVQVLLPEVQSLMADAPERLVSDDPAVGGNGNFGIGGGLEEFSVQKHVTIQVNSPQAQNVYADTIDLVHPLNSRLMGTVLLLSQGHGTPFGSHEAGQRALTALYDALSSSLFAEVVQRYTGAPEDQKTAWQARVQGFVSNRFRDLHEELFMIHKKDRGGFLTKSGSSMAVAILLYPAGAKPELLITKAGRGSVYLLNESDRRFDPLTPDFSFGWSVKALARGVPSDDLYSVDMEPAVLAEINDAARSGNRSLNYYLGMNAITDADIAADPIIYQRRVSLKPQDKVILMSDRVADSWPHEGLRNVFFRAPREFSKQLDRVLPLVDGNPAVFPLVMNEMNAPLDSTGQAAQKRAAVPAVVGAYLDEEWVLRNLPEEPVLTAVQREEPTAAPADRSIRMLIVPNLPPAGMRALADIGGQQYGNATVSPGLRIPVSRISSEGLVIRLGLESGFDQLVTVSRTPDGSLVGRLFDPVTHLGTREPVIDPKTGLPEFSTNAGTFRHQWTQADGFQTLGRSVNNLVVYSTNLGVISRSQAVIGFDVSNLEEPLLVIRDGDGQQKDSYNGTWVHLASAGIPVGPASPEAGREGEPPVPVEQFIETVGPAEWARIPAGANAVWVMPLPSTVNVYSQESLLAGVGEQVLSRLPAELKSVVRLVQIPLAPPEAYGRPGMIFKDAGLTQPVDNPLGLPVVETWLSDLGRINPAAVILLALRGREDAGVKLLGLMTYQDAKGQTYLAIFA